MQLFREIGLGPSTLVVIGNIIGIGIYTTSGLIAEEVGPSAWVLGVWVIGGGLALMGALCYSVLSTRIPRAGGEYAFLYPSYGPLAAFLSGWTSLLIGFAAPIAASALGFSHYAVAALRPEGTEHAGLLTLVGMAALLLVTLLLTVGLRFGSWVHSIITLFNLVLIIGFSGLVVAQAPLGRNLGSVLTPRSPADLPSLASAVVLVMFAYSGWNAAAYLAEEIRNPGRYIPISLTLGTLTVLGIYLLMNVAYFGAVPFSDLEGKVVVAEIAARATLGDSGTVLVNVLILFSILSSLTAMSIAGPRVYFAMSRDRLFPSWLATIDSRRKLPLASIWFQNGIAALLVLVGTLRQILIFSGFVLLFFATLTVSTLFRFKNEPASSFRFPFLYRLLPAIFVTVNVLVLINAAVSYPRESGAGLLTVISGIPVYWYYRRRSQSIVPPVDPSG